MDRNHPQKNIFLVCPKRELFIVFCRCVFLLDVSENSKYDEREIFLGGVYSMLIYVQMIETPQDKSKFEAIYEEYYGLMYHTAYKYLKHEQDAEDAVHHAFVKIAENIRSTASRKIL